MTPTPSWSQLPSLKVASLHTRPELHHLSTRRYALPDRRLLCSGLRLVHPPE